MNTVWNAPLKSIQKSTNNDSFHYLKSFKIQHIRRMKGNEEGCTHKTNSRPNLNFFVFIETFSAGGRVITVWYKN